VHYVILGNGVAGVEAAQGVRGLDPSSRITLVSAESDHFFSRPALMYIFAGQMRLQDTEPHDRGFYSRMRFERVRAAATATRELTGEVQEDADSVEVGVELTDFNRCPVLTPDMSGCDGRTIETA